MIRFAWLKHGWHTTKGMASADSVPATACAELTWSCDRFTVDEITEKEQLFQSLRDLCRVIDKKKTSSTNKLLAQCYLTLANWERELNEGLTEVPHTTSSSLAQPMTTAI
jgi:hypothetical protein